MLSRKLFRKKTMVNQSTHEETVLNSKCILKKPCLPNVPMITPMKKTMLQQYFPRNEYDKLKLTMKRPCSIQNTFGKEHDQPKGPMKRPCSTHNTYQKDHVYPQHTHEKAMLYPKLFVEKNIVNPK